MKVNTLINEFGFKLIAGGEFIERDIKGIYCCDLLSWVMSHANQSDAWITVQTHVNIVAVASLLDLACIIIPESIDIDKDTINKANEEKIPLLSTNLKTYEIFKRFYEAGMR